MYIDSLSMIGVMRHVDWSWNQYLSTSDRDLNEKVMGSNRSLASLVQKEERGSAVDVSRNVTA